MIFRINNFNSACMIVTNDNPNIQLMGFVFPLTQNFTPNEVSETELWCGWT